jgi:hypothetical protein
MLPSLNRHRNNSGTRADERRVRRSRQGGGAGDRCRGGDGDWHVDPHAAWCFWSLNTPLEKSEENASPYQTNHGGGEGALHGRIPSDGPKDRNIWMCKL